MSVKLVAFGLLSLRAVQRTLQYFEPWFKGGVPSHTNIQLWLLRFGLYKLEQSPQKADDWIYILDHTIEFGAKKCLLILGIRQSFFLESKCKITHKDLTVLDISIQESATAKTVTESLKKVADKTGIPAQIVSDNGSNIKKGAKDFINEFSENRSILRTYDVTHKAAIILKKALGEDEVVKSFSNLVAKSKTSLTHTKLCYLAAPKPREKSRWLNLDSRINWALKIMKMKKSQIPKDQTEQYTKHLLWVRKFKKDIKEWKSILDILNALKKEVKNNGINKTTITKFKQRIVKIKINTVRLQNVKNSVLEYLKEECEGVLGVYLGCSDIIESTFGKYKNYSSKSPMKEIGKSVLTIPAFTCDINEEEMKEAMEKYSNKDVTEWIENNIGKSLLQKRTEAFNTNKKKVT